MKEYLLEIGRQKWRLLSVMLVFILINVVLGIIVSAYQIPSLVALQSRWNNLRLQVARSGDMADPATVYRQGALDLEKLKSKIPAKSQFARVLSDLLETAASNDVQVGTISYKPVLFKDEDLLSYQLSLSATGRYAAVKSFLADLQNNQEMLVVDNVTFSNNDLMVEKVVMALNITIYLREGV